MTNANINADFKAYKATHPDALFSEFYRAAILEMLAKGEKTSSIGSVTMSTKGERSFLEGGAKVARDYIAAYGIEPANRVLDYGCGSLRIGCHFINYLGRGKYFGMDIAPEFLEIGRNALGRTSKKPTLLPITPENVEAGRKFGAGFIISHSVHYHVHPDEQTAYFANLAALTRRRGARLIFNAKISDQPRHYGRAAWAWPIEHFVSSLPALQFIKHTRPRPVTKHPGVTAATFVFRRA